MGSVPKGDNGTVEFVKREAEAYKQLDKTRVLGVVAPARSQAKATTPTECNTSVLHMSYNSVKLLHTSQVITMNKQINKYLE